MFYLALIMFAVILTLLFSYRKSLIFMFRRIGTLIVETALKLSLKSLPKAHASVSLKSSPFSISKYLPIIIYLFVLTITLRNILFNGKYVFINSYIGIFWGIFLLISSLYSIYLITISINKHNEQTLKEKIFSLFRGIYSNPLLMLALFSITLCLYGLIRRPLLLLLGTEIGLSYYCTCLFVFFSTWLLITYIKGIFQQIFCYYIFNNKKKLDYSLSYVKKTINRKKAKTFLSYFLFAVVLKVLFYLVIFGNIYI